MSRMSERIIKEIIKKHDTADIFISLFFASFDLVLYLTILFLFGCYFNNIFSRKQILSLLIIIDGAYRIINLYFNSFVYAISREIVYTCIATSQFFLMLFLLNQIFSDKNFDNSLGTIEIKFPISSSIVFFLFAITLNSLKIISLVQYGLAIITILLYSYYIGNKIELFLAKMDKISTLYEGRNIIYNLPLFIAIYFIIFYILKILGLLVENKLYCSYMELTCDIFKEVGKYLTFSFVISIYYLFNKYIKEDNLDYSTETTQNSVTISNSYNSYNN